jgi:DNA-binding MarR family transcriptional regulator
LDSVAVAIDALSILVLISVVIVAWKAVRAFKQGRQAVTESASLLGVIVNALTARIESSESLMSGFRTDIETLARRGNDLENHHSDLQASYLQVLRYLQDALSNDKRMVLELERLKSRLTSIEERPVSPIRAQISPRSELSMPSADLTTALTPTELQTVEILRREGPKGAPELGKRIRKSREHMARLMKKLYMDGYVDRENTRTPFRYKLNEKVRQTMEDRSIVTAATPEKA